MFIAPLSLVATAVVVVGIVFAVTWHNVVLISAK